MTKGCCNDIYNLVYIMRHALTLHFSFSPLIRFLVCVATICPRRFLYRRQCLLWITLTMISMFSATTRMERLMWCTSGTLAVSALSSPANKYAVFGDGLASVERRSRCDHALCGCECAKATIYMNAAKDCKSWQTRAKKILWCGDLIFA